MMGDQNESIEIRVDKISQLFDSLDPFPFRERDLDSHAEEYIVGWARELPHDTPIQIVIHVPASEFKSEHAKELNESLHRYFEYRAAVIGRELKQLFSIGRKSALIGAAVLAICILGAQIVPKTLGTGNISIYLRKICTSSAGLRTGSQSKFSCTIGGRLPNGAISIDA